MLKEIKNTEGKYCICHNGDIIIMGLVTADQINCEILPHRFNSKGYRVATLVISGKPKTFTVHDLLAEYFLV